MSYVTGTEAFDAWSTRLHAGESIPIWSMGPTFSTVEFGPGQILVVAGAPGSGKTLLVMQWLSLIMDNHPGVRAYIANVEMTPDALLCRELARRSLLPLGLIRKDAIDLSEPNTADALAAISQQMERVAFQVGSGSLNDVAAGAADFGANLIVLDYLQRFRLDGESTSEHESLTDLMAAIRQMAMQHGVGFLCCSAVSRNRNSKGSSYQALGMANLRGSSELEFNADTIYVLNKSDGGPVLEHAKDRAGNPLEDIPLEFHDAAFWPTMVAASSGEEWDF